MTTPETTAPNITAADAPADAPAREAWTAKRPDSKQALLVQMLRG